MKITVFLLDILGASGRTHQVFVVVLVWALCLTLLPGALLIDGLLFVWNVYRLWRWSRQAVIYCPNRHPVQVTGNWECQACKCTFYGSGILPCPFCHATSHLRCPCGVTVRGPLVVEER